MKTIIRSKKYLRGAKDQACVKCGCNDGTIVGAHYSGLRCHTYGKGTGIKVHDVLIADLCMECHNYFDSPDLGLRHDTQANRNWKKTERSEEFLHYVALTIVRRCRQGILYSDDMDTGQQS